jgi:hypothetical protein
MMFTFYCSDTKHILFGCPICINEVICQVVSWRKIIYCARHLHNMIDLSKWCAWHSNISYQRKIMSLWCDLLILSYYFSLRWHNPLFKHSIPTMSPSLFLYQSALYAHCSIEVLRRIFQYNSCHLQMSPTRNGIFYGIINVFVCFIAALLLHLVIFVTLLKSIQHCAFLSLTVVPDFVLMS